MHSFDARSKVRLILQDCVNDAVCQSPWREQCRCTPLGGAASAETENRGRGPMLSDRRNGSVAGDWKRLRRGRLRRRRTGDRSPQGKLYHESYDLTSIYYQTKTSRKPVQRLTWTLFVTSYPHVDFESSSLHYRRVAAAISSKSRPSYVNDCASNSGVPCASRQLLWKASSVSSGGRTSNVTVYESVGSPGSDTLRA